MPQSKIADITDDDLWKLLYLWRLDAMDHHLNFMSYTWTNQTTPFIVGYHTRQICACIDYAIEKFRQGKSTYWVITVPFRHGKLLPTDTPIFTMGGWKNHGDLQLGDYVFGADGLPHRVIANTGAYEWDTVKITFNHGEEIICAREHLWKIKRFIDNRKGRARIKVGPEYVDKILETQEIELPTKKRSNRPPFIDITMPLQMPERNLPIDPYVLGVWLGDGHSIQGIFTKNEEDGDYIAEKIRCRYAVSKKKDVRKHDCYDYKIDGLLELIKNNGFYNDLVSRKFSS
jgi:hypothetical protein